MAEDRPAALDPPDEAAPGETMWAIGVRPRCTLCDRLAVTYGADETPLCARHATIFLTAGRREEDGPAT